MNGPLNTSTDSAIRATTNSRTGILTRTGQRSLYQPIVHRNRSKSNKVATGGTGASESNAPAELARLLGHYDHLSAHIDSASDDSDLNVKTEPEAEQEKPKVKAKGPSLKKDKSGQPFDFKLIKILIKKSGNEKEQREVFLDREWVQTDNTIPHFANVIKNVDKNEGVEITMNCNADAFNWIIAFVKISTDNKGQSEDRIEELLYTKMDEITYENCLNILVTAYFLQLHWVYQKVWDYFFARNFSEVINSCKISLTNINQAIVKDIADRIPDISLELMQERKDKFISNVYKSRIDQKIIAANVPLFYCGACKKLLTRDQASLITCVQREDNPLIEEQPES